MKPTLAELIALIADAKLFHQAILNSGHPNVTPEEVRWAIQIWWISRFWVTTLPKK